MSIPILSDDDFFEKIKTQKNPFYHEYYAFYSSWFGGILKNPKAMLLPIDDHMVHRGDGVFEAMKAVGRSVYLMDEHLDRLFNSAEKIALKLSFDIQQLKEIILETLRAADQDEASIRVFISRGPGNFSVNPYDSIATQLYVIITKLVPPAAEKYEQGTIIGKSHVPCKPSWLAQVKSCNYLQNVLMKKESVDRGLDFVISIDEQGYITESATENVMLVDQTGTIIHPVLDNILKGTTMIRACELARENGIAVEIKSISTEELLLAKEVIITGTSLNILPVVKFEDNPIGNGRPGPLAQQLNALMLNDIKNGAKNTHF